MYTHVYWIPAGWPCRYLPDAPRCVVGAKGPGVHVPMWDNAPQAAPRGLGERAVPGMIRMRMLGDDERPGAYAECLWVWRAWNWEASTRAHLPMRCPSDPPVVEHGWAPACAGAVSDPRDTQDACAAFEARCTQESDTHALGAVCHACPTQVASVAPPSTNGVTDCTAPRAARCVFGKALGYLPQDNCNDATRVLRLPPYPEDWRGSDRVYDPPR